MHLGLNESEALLRDTLDRFFAENATSERYRASEATGFDAQLWTDFAGLGMHQLRTGEAQGGVGGSLLDALMLAEAYGSTFAAIPAIEAMLAGKLLAELGGSVIAAGDAPDTAGGFAVLALRDCAESPAQIVPGAAGAAKVLMRHGAVLRVVDLDRQEPEAVAGLVGARILTFADDAGVELARGAEAIAAFEAIVAEWKLLNAALLAASGRAALRAAAEYARERIAFDRPIGSYQGLAHPLAEAFAEIDGASLLVRRAIEAIAHSREFAAALVEMAWWWAGHAASNATIKAMRAFGGYGLMKEHDAQIHVRRAISISTLLGDPAHSLDIAAQYMWDREALPPPALPDAGAVEQSFEFPAEVVAVMERARAVFRRHIERKGRIDHHDIELNKSLAAEGLLYPDWPTSAGGGGYDATVAAAVKYVFSEFEASNITISTSSMLGKMILNFGSDRARTEILPQLAGGDAYGALCYSEPSGGSDIFAAKSRATRDGDDWIINGQKMFTSGGHTGRYGLFIARTGESKHGGITLFAVPFDQPGYAFTPVYTMSDDRTNITFYNDVRVPDAYRLGEVNGGVKVLAAALTLEQSDGPFYTSAFDRMLRPVIAFARLPRGTRPPLLELTDARRRLAAIATYREVTDVLSRRTIWASANGVARKYHGPASKLFGSEAWVRGSADLMRLTAPESLDQNHSVLAALDQEYRASFASTIYAGTSEVQRSIIAEDALGLPRSRS